MKPRTRLLFDAGVLARQQTGVGFYVEHLIRALAENYPHEIELVGYYFRSPGRNIQPVDIPNVSYLPIRWLPRQILLAAGLLGIRLPLRLFVKNWRSFDAVLYPNFTGFLTPKTLPSIVVIYDLCFIDHPEYVDTLNARYLRLCVPRSVAKATLVIADSEFTKDRIVDRLGVNPKKIDVVYPGVSFNSLVKASPKSIFRPVLYVGTIEPRKNIENLLLAYEKLPKTIQQEHPLVLCGSSGWKNQSIFSIYNELKRKGVPTDYRGYISDSEKAELYANAAAVAVVSHYEGFGMQILEAMHFNVPLLISDISVFHEVAGDSAYYCDPNNPQKIAEALATLLSADNKIKLSYYRYRLSLFSWDRAADEFMSLLSRFK